MHVAQVPPTSPGRGMAGIWEPCTAPQAYHKNNTPIATSTLLSGGLWTISQA